MKTLFASLFFSVFFIVGAQAQGAIFNDTMLIFNLDPSYLFGKNLEIERVDMNKAFTIAGPSKQAVRLLPNAMAKKVVVPRATKTVRGSLILSYQGNCYEFACRKGDDCTNCKMLWYDRNGDGKVQPAKELRCGCETQQQCKIGVRNSSCD